MQTSKQAASFAKLSLLSTIITVLLATISHVYIFGFRAFMIGIVFSFLIIIFYIQFQRKKSKIFHLFYFLFNAIIIIGFGIINGFWNHAIKIALIYLHGGQLPPPLVGLFQTPTSESFFQESIGVLTFIASMFSAYYGFKIFQKKQLK